MHPFRSFMENYVSLPTKDWTVIEAKLHKKVYEKGALLLTEGEVCRHLYFLESGFLRYFVNKDGIEVTKFFTQAPYCFTAQRSFNQQTAATQSIQALEKSTVWQLNRTAAFDLFELKSWNEFIRLLVQEVQFYTEQILEDIQNNTAEHRYRRMLNNGSPLLDKVPLKYLASYLGIAPQSLSRIRKNLLAEKRS